MSTKAFAVAAWSFRHRARMSQAVHPACVLACLITASVAVTPRPVLAQEILSPTVADYVAAKNRVAMARVDAELAKIQREAKGDGKDSPQGVPTAPYGGYVQPLAKPAAPVEPTVQRVKATSDGKLVAMIALGNGTVIPAWSGKNLGRGLVVQSVTTSDVIVKDSTGVRPLAWGDTSSTGSGPGGASYGSPSAVPMGLPPPPSMGN